MPRARTIFLCLECGTSHERHMGRCPDCNTFNSLKEHRIAPNLLEKNLDRSRNVPPQFSSIRSRLAKRIASRQGSTRWIASSVVAWCPAVAC